MEYKGKLFHPDYLDMLRCLTERNVEFVIVGAYAMSFHGHVRATGDIDILVRPTEENSKKVFSALKDFGAPMIDTREDDFAKSGVIYQIGVVPVRIDIITKIDGVPVEDVFENCDEILIEKMNIRFISLPLLLKNKSSTGRPKDMVDVEELQKELKDKIRDYGKR